MDNKMYEQRIKNIPAFRGCGFGCSYCAFKKLIQLNKKCKDCVSFAPHAHLEALRHTPPKPKDGEFLTIGLGGDVSFMPIKYFWLVIEYCREWKDRTFLIQSKKPAYFWRFQEGIAPLRIPDNVILGTTIETNRAHIWKSSDPLNIRYDYQDISGAPLPEKRYEAMLELTCRKVVTIEPVLSFSLQTMTDWILKINPEFVYIGYNSNLKLKLPEPTLSQTNELIKGLRVAGIDVRPKLIRTAFYE